MTTSWIKPFQRRVRLLPYPAGKLFAFTIVDDTDGQTLDVIRAVYDELEAMGFRTTKTVWVTAPAQKPASPWDIGDTLDDPEHVAYLQRLRQQGFEIALHNVSSGSNKREAIAAGIERFRSVFGHYPKMNIHHEKNRENLYFDVANDPARLPGSFRSPVVRGLQRLLRRGRQTHPGRTFDCSGDCPESEYFWGDICQRTIKYVRTNVFLDRFNTIRYCPQMPISFADTPYVNFWFYSSEGQDAPHFNHMLSKRNIQSLRSENGASILYTHFGKGFVRQENGRQTLNRETRDRLRYLAQQPDGWFVPCSELLDRLLAFQKVLIAPFSNSFAIRNGNDFSVRDITVLAPPLSTYYTPGGCAVISDGLGRLVIQEIGPGQTLVFLKANISEALTPWHAPESAFIADVKELWGRLRGAAGRMARGGNPLPPRTVAD